MLCEGCCQQKLRREFPHENVCKNQHAQLYCLRCVTKSIERRRKCPACDDSVLKIDSQYLACVQKLNWLFPPFEDEEAASARESLEYERDHRFLIRNITINVVMLNGDKKSVTVSRSSTISDLKKTISIQFGIDSKKQRLIYNDKSLESFNKSNQLMKVSDYNITDNSTITLIKVLKTISDSLKHVTFDFHWNYVSYSRDFLNVSAILYRGSVRVAVIDFRNTVFLDGIYGPGYGAVTHSGHGFRNNWRGRRGNHKIEVNFDLLSLTTIDKVFFTLSALNAESIEDFQNLTLDFHDSRNPSEQLDEINRAVQDHKAVVFCCLCRIDGSWQVIALQEPSFGNVRDYNPLYRTVDRIIRNGFS